ncbi:uncharacterized protein LOC132261951 [Phlebotomus argentipes]|uniref:uncharacterized protein LOC132261951 n=1 Tax=Phlebotomus argentipes TaxID=94469 RepID=UPI0028937A38|nr:uncharacterized protein LOC132261951 [Phlebotomus argentipes]
MLPRMTPPLWILLLASLHWSEIAGTQGVAAPSRDRADNVDETSDIEENFIALVPDRTDEMRSNEISINPIATLVLSEYPGRRERDYRNVSMKSTPSHSSKSLTSQEVEDKWPAGGKGRGWHSLAKQKYHSRTAKRHNRKHHHHNRAAKKRSRPHNYYFESEESRSPYNSRDKWPNLLRLQSQLQQEKEEDIPPYMKKINRRTKQLRVLMEGDPTVAPRRLRQPPFRFPEPQWMEENLFEEQRANVKKSPSRSAIKGGSRNSLPGEESEEAVEMPAMLKSATRAGNFIYHRVPSAKPSTGPTFGRVVRKQGLPFVAITDRRAKIHP